MAAPLILSRQYLLFWQQMRIKIKCMAIHKILWYRKVSIYMNIKQIL